MIKRVNSVSIGTPNKILLSFYICRGLAGEWMYFVLQKMNAL